MRYGEVDQMGYLHHGNYALYLEQARTELLRDLGLSYKKMEEEGVLLPVREMKIRYLNPATYDEVLTIKTRLVNIPSVRLDFEYEIFNENNLELCKASTTLVFVNVVNKKPMRAPEYLKKRIEERIP